MTALESGPLPQRLRQLERLVHEIEEGPESPVRARARQIVAAVLALHADALRSMLERVAADGGSDSTLLDSFVRDPQIAAVLMLHGLHPADLESRVRGALESMAPALEAEELRIRAVAVTEGAVRVALAREPGRGGRPAAAWRARIEEAIVAAAPDASAIEIELPLDFTGFVPLDQVRLRPGASARPTR